jgi:ferredoxin
MAWRLRHKDAFTAAPSHLIVNPVACDGVGLCAHLAPEIVSLDRWGFPIVSDAPLNGTARAAARRAVAGCPRSALFLTAATNSEDSENAVDN